MTLATSSAEVEIVDRACVRGVRTTVGMIDAQIGAGQSIGDMLANYPYLQRDDVLHALRYASSAG